MPEPFKTLEYPEGYHVELFYDEDASNPVTEFDSQPKIIMHAGAERRCGWTTDREWAGYLEEALSHDWKTFKRLAQVHDAFTRWARAYHRVAAILPFTLYEHSGQMVELGTVGRDKWDSGWVGYMLITDEQWRDWQGLGPDGPIDHVGAELSLRASFSEFASWVSGDCYSFAAYDPEGNHVGSCGGFYGSDSYAEQQRTKFTLGQRPLPGWRIETPDDGDLEISTSAEFEGGWFLQFVNAGLGMHVAPGDVITLVHPGYMREIFEDEVRCHREAQHLKTQALYKQLVGAR